MNIPQEQFEKIVEEALDNLPNKFKEKMHNVAIVIADFPTSEQLGKTKKYNKYSLLGLYEGVIQSRRLNFGVVLPDKITIFRVPLMQTSSNTEDCKKNIIDTVKHEIAHHFGSDEKGARKAAKHQA
ncbi:MAG: Possibl zinc metallo-peptidase [Parcubacteria group bacterium ADurb.Bin316]|nr:MAG: Possibl zinc metallo-peptidase [Parcubacteria group bacterium ADurb.Bin316]HOZ55655.1 metallopeptidase family protein [bacterium]